MVETGAPRKLRLYYDSGASYIEIDSGLEINQVGVPQWEKFKHLAAKAYASIHDNVDADCDDYMGIRPAFDDEPVPEVPESTIYLSEQP